MTDLAMSVIILSTFMHAGWNLIARGQPSEAAFFRWVLILIVIAGLGPAIVSEMLWPTMARAWGWVALSGTCSGFYFLCLAKSYHLADFTVVYPVVRALPVLIIAAAEVALNRHPTVAGWAGMSLVVLGCLLAPLTTLTQFHGRLYFRTASVWMLITAMATVGYTLMDKTAVQRIPQGPLHAAVYCYWYMLFAYLCYEVLLRCFRLPKSRPKLWPTTVLSAIFQYMAYGMIVWAYQLVHQASYVVAFRQFSIVIGVILAFAIFKEPGRVVRIPATLLITAGLLVIGIWG